jgi:hypothetical protein
MVADLMPDNSTHIQGQVPLPYSVFQAFAHDTLLRYRSTITAGSFMLVMLLQSASIMIKALVVAP